MKKLCGGDSALPHGAATVKSIRSMFLCNQYENACCAPTSFLATVRTYMLWWWVEFSYWAPKLFLALHYKEVGLRGYNYNELWFKMLLLKMICLKLPAEVAGDLHASVWGQRAVLPCIPRSWWWRSSPKMKPETYSGQKRVSPSTRQKVILVLVV